MLRAEDILRHTMTALSNVKCTYRTACIWRTQELLRTGSIVVVIRVIILQEFWTIITVIPIFRDRHFRIVSEVHVVVCSKVKMDINGQYQPRKSEHATQIELSPYPFSPG